MVGVIFSSVSLNLNHKIRFFSFCKIIKHTATHGVFYFKPAWGLKVEGNKLNLPVCLESVQHVI